MNRNNRKWLEMNGNWMQKWMENEMKNEWKMNGNEWNGNW